MTPIQVERKAAGLCVRCSAQKSSLSKSLCNRHLLDLRERVQRGRSRNRKCVRSPIEKLMLALCLEDETW